MSDARDLPRYLEGYGQVGAEDDEEMLSEGCTRNSLRDEPGADAGSGDRSMPSGTAPNAHEG